MYQPTAGGQDIGDVEGPEGVTFTPAFQIDGTLTFMPLRHGRAFFNGDIALKVEEVKGFVDAILANDLEFQAFHQHFDEMNPQIWYVHWRGVGRALELAQAVRHTVDATSTPLPQTKPQNPTTPLDADRLARVLGGEAEVGEEGVVTVTVPRGGHVVIGGILASPQSNISTNVQFKPLGDDDSRAAVAPDFSMTAHEIGPVVSRMRHTDWDLGCLYNQETDEHPQLYFSHMLKTGDPYALAREVREGLDLTCTR
ncbi:DUF1259 domain-containing protein [Actinopolymorpha singaporensis]|uniref:Uncharacterized protein n=1 Tax=Actinopolymorpha singaporensis TaxID=117157 RepID=A0A1H1W534_9ACTN|nr:DUF1259 domain-containing protein [Actinopolymorpha singaporensis]SDS92257.1 protein of unknown function [Actinopolymorpha singaporensis]